MTRINVYENGKLYLPYWKLERGTGYVVQSDKFGYTKYICADESTLSKWVRDRERLSKKIALVLEFKGDF